MSGASGTTGSACHSPDDARRLAGCPTIYADGIATENATFETTVPTRDEWNEIAPDDLCFVGTIDDGTVIGWIAAGDVSDRCCYAGVIEHSVYVAPAHQATVSVAPARPPHRHGPDGRRVDDPDRHLPGEPGQPRPSRGSGVPSRRAT